MNVCVPAVVGGFSVPDEALLNDDAGCGCCCCCVCCGNCNVVEEEAAEEEEGASFGSDVGVDVGSAAGASDFLSEDEGALKASKIQGDNSGRKTSR